MKIKRIASAMLALLLLLFAACAKQPAAPAPTTQLPEPGGPSLTVSFDYAKQSGTASNQFAVWIEDMDGKLVKTLCATEFTAKGGYKNRPDSIAVWVSKAIGVSDFDAVASATPKSSGEVSYVWDLTDEAGEAVPPGTYKFLVEGTLRWKNYVLCTGEIGIGGADASTQAVAGFAFEGEGRQPALDKSAVETEMITNVKAEYIA